MKRDRKYGKEVKKVENWNRVIKEYRREEEEKQEEGEFGGRIIKCISVRK